jgi:hypothetical protein
MSDDPILAARPLGFPWPTEDPFLACMHHNDAYPAGNAQHGPQASLTGRDIGQDFSGKDGWSMYHGDGVPGFPQHPHRGFETVTIVRRGLVDHADSMGATARYGNGDVQWLTVGRGIVHAEMFPLLDDQAPNPLELFQVWLNLPKANKFAEPHFAMLWDRHIPVHRVVDAQGRVTDVRVMAGVFPGAPKPPSPPPASWASDPRSDVAIWTLKIAPGAHVTLPASSAGLNRWLYFFAGDSLTVDGRTLEGHGAVKLKSDVDVVLENGTTEGELLVLQGRPLREPVAQAGPFVMNTRAEVEQAFADYQRTRFGGWPWPKDGPVHGAVPERFAQKPGADIER